VSQSVGVAVPSAPEQGEQPKPDLGVLFVHGIGEQKQGETLTSFADALSGWFSSWITDGCYVEPGIGPLDPAEVVLSRTELAPGDALPAQSVLTVRADDELGGERTWLLRESWWAGTFQQPKTSTLLKWMLGILPYMVVEQLAAPLLRSLRLMSTAHGRFRKTGAGFRALLFLVLLILSLPIAGFGIVLVLLLLFPVVIPVPTLQDYAKKAGLKLAATLGDSFILIASSVQFDAMVHRVARDLESLAVQVSPKPVAVVAHSQGTALSYEAIRRYGRPDNLHLFVTLGQAIEKLERARFLRRKDSNRRYTAAWFAVASFYVLAVFTPRAVVEGLKRGTEHGHWFWSYVGLAAGGALVLALSGTYLGMLFRSMKRDLKIEPLDDGGLAWNDFYASVDPVPNGPLFDDPVAGFEENEVWNRASAVSDHTSYLDARDDFVAYLACDLALLSAGKVKSPDLRDRLQWARSRRWWRLFWLTTMRSLAVAAAGAAVGAFAAAGRLSEIGHGVPSWMSDIVRYLTKPIRAVVVVGTLSDELLTGIVVVAIVIAAGFLLLSLIWRAWELDDVGRWFRRETVTLTSPLGGLAFAGFFTGLALMIGISVEAGIYANYPTSWHALAHHWLWALPTLSLFPAFLCLRAWAGGLYLKRLEAWLMTPVGPEVENPPVVELPSA
jgi:uncharacterized membrane protein YgdD (TMEM256/DUF423 family)